jgi:plasmid stabilization system protein ParE
MRLADYPESGRVVPEVGSESLRELIIGRYRVIYRYRAPIVEIATVLHGARRFTMEG